MSDIFLQDDIIDALKSHIYIRDYDKLGKVSVKYNKCFDLKTLKYEEIMIIRGCSVEILVNIITKNVTEKYNYEEIKDISDKILKNKEMFSLSLENKGHYVLKYIITLYYNCYNNNYRGIIMSLCIFNYICNKWLDKYNFAYFINPVISYIEDINDDNIISLFNIDDDSDDDSQDIVKSKMLVCINLNIYLSIIMKSIKTIIPNNSPIKINNQFIDIINNGLRDNVLNYIDTSINTDRFPVNYITYVKYICNNIRL